MQDHDLEFPRFEDGLPPNFKPSTLNFELTCYSATTLQITRGSTPLLIGELEIVEDFAPH